MKRCVIVSSWLVVFRSFSHSSSNNNIKTRRRAACVSVFIQPVQQNTATRPPNVELKLEKGHRQRWKQRKHSSHSTKVSPPPTHVVLLPWCGSVCAGLVGSFAPSCFSLSGPQLPVTKKTRRARRARIEARTATLRDHKAEIAAQERELAAAVKKVEGKERG